MLQIVLTILGGLIAGWAGISVARDQEKRKMKRNLKILSVEIKLNIKSLDMYREGKLEGIKFLFDIFQTTAFTIANSSGALATLPKDKHADIYDAYYKILLYQRVGEITITGKPKGYFFKIAEDSLIKAREALKSTGISLDC